MKNNCITVLFVFLIAFCLSNCVGAGSNKAENSESNVNQQLYEVAKEINKKCPIPVDENTRMDSASVYNQFMITYHYTVHTVINKEVDFKMFKAKMQTAMTEKYNGDPQFAIYRNNNIAIAYDYKDRAGDFLCYFICEKK